MATLMTAIACPYFFRLMRSSTFDAFGWLNQLRATILRQ